MKKLTFIIVLFLSSYGCSTENIYGSGDCFIPEVAVNETINTALPQYYHLQTIGNYSFLPGGNNGIFLVHNFDGMFYALERTCPYQSDNECSVIQIDSTSLQLKCGAYADTGFVKCCDSRYLLDGLLIQGPSICNLKRYRVNASGSTLFINN